MKKLSKILILAAVIAVAIALPCYAEADYGVTVVGVVESVGDWWGMYQDEIAVALMAVLTGVFNVSTGTSNRKTRKQAGKEAAKLVSASTSINNNAVNLATTIKNEIANMIRSVADVVEKAIKNLLDKMDEQIAATRENTKELKALRREQKALGVMWQELLKDSELTTVRKEEIMKIYNEERKGENDEEQHEA